MVMSLLQFLENSTLELVENFAVVGLLLAKLGSFLGLGIDCGWIVRVDFTLTLEDEDVRESAMLGLLS